MSQIEPVLALLGIILIPFWVPLLYHAITIIKNFINIAFIRPSLNAIKQTMGLEPDNSAIDIKANSLDYDMKRLDNWAHSVLKEYE